VITLAHYFRDFERTHGLLLSVDLRANAARTVDLANRLMVMAKGAGVTLVQIPGTDSIVPSGWRPADYNATLPNAKPRSLHITCEAIDVNDPDGDLDEWLITPDGQRVLTDLVLWHEHPAATKGWAHLQTKPPRSGRRTFYP
jgi:hypothetical protein